MFAAFFAKFLEMSFFIRIFDEVKPSNTNLYYENFFENCCAFGGGADVGRGIDVLRQRRRAYKKPS